eukprot:g30296.t1
MRLQIVIEYNSVAAANGRQHITALLSTNSLTRQHIHQLRDTLASLELLPYSKVNAPPVKCWYPRAALHIAVICSAHGRQGSFTLLRAGIKPPDCTGPSLWIMPGFRTQGLASPRRPPDRNSPAGDSLRTRTLLPAPAS